jgi:hypothetical protein
MSISIINTPFRLQGWPDSLISALHKDRNSMVDSFVDEAVRFYIIMLVYPSFPVQEVMMIAKNPDRYDVTFKEMDDGSYLVTINKEVIE